MYLTEKKIVIAGVEIPKELKQLTVRQKQINRLSKKEKFEMLERAQKENLIFDTKEELKIGVLEYIEKLLDKQLKRIKPGESVAIDCNIYPMKADGTFKDNANMRFDVEYDDWRKAVFERDNYTCVECGAKGRIQAHHIKEWANNVSERFNINNGITLCVKCHCKKHPGKENLIRKSKARRVI